MLTPNPGSPAKGDEGEASSTDEEMRQRNSSAANGIHTALTLEVQMTGYTRNPKAIPIDDVWYSPAPVVQARLEPVGRQAKKRKWQVFVSRFKRSVTGAFGCFKTDPSATLD